MYKETHKDHFINGVWQAYNLPELIDFTIKKLTDKNFVGSKSKAALFKTSFLDETWFRQAVSVIGLKMLEDNENLNGLTSNTAKELIFIRKVIKMSYEKTGQIIGRSTKNHNAEYMREELKEITTQTYKFVQQHLKNFILANTEEIALLKEFEGEYFKALKDTRMILLSA